MEQVIEKVDANTEFLEANTVKVYKEEISDKHIIPVFSKSNEPLISHSDLIESVQEAVSIALPALACNEPQIRVSHPVKGRVPEARHKRAGELLEGEITLYYERMAFFVEVPEISYRIGSNNVSLSIGAVKAYNLDNLSSRNENNQMFKFFIGFKNQVCTNLCISSDGYIDSFKTGDKGELLNLIIALIQNFQMESEIKALQEFNKVILTEREFVNIIGRLKLFLNLPLDMQKEIFDYKISITESQLSALVKSYVNDQNFGYTSDSGFSIWKLYNLLTGTIKSSYADNYLDRSVFSYQLSCCLSEAITTNRESWFLQ
mgnify:CR=1 FL=1